MAVMPKGMGPKKPECDKNDNMPMAPKKTPAVSKPKKTHGGKTTKQLKGVSMAKKDNPKPKPQADNSEACKKKKKGK